MRVSARKTLLTGSNTGRWEAQQRFDAGPSPSFASGTRPAKSSLMQNGFLRFLHAGEAAHKPAGSGFSLQALGANLQALGFGYGQTRELGCRSLVVSRWSSVVGRQSLALGRWLNPRQQDERSRMPSRNVLGLCGCSLPRSTTTPEARDQQPATTDKRLTASDGSRLQLVASQILSCLLWRERYSVVTSQGRTGRFDHLLECPLIAFRSSPGAFPGRGGPGGHPMLQNVLNRVLAKN